MNKEYNKKEREEKSLTNEEWFAFFIKPVNISPRIFQTEDFNDTEVERFKKHGFKTKLKQSLIARGLGILFYLILIVIISTLIN